MIILPGDTMKYPGCPSSPKITGISFFGMLPTGFRVQIPTDSFKCREAAYFPAWRAIAIGQTRPGMHVRTERARKKRSRPYGLNNPAQEAKSYILVGPPRPHFAFRRGGFCKFTGA